MEDVFRKTYKQQTGQIISQMDEIKTKAEELYTLLEGAKSDPRMQSLAKTKLEESIMWIIKGMTG